jgi:hypothetical protein
METGLEDAGWRARRFLLTPVVVVCCLAIGAAIRLSGRAHEADVLWSVGLVLTGLPLTLRTLRDMVRGRFATDVVATLAIVVAVVQGQHFAGLVIVLMQSGGEALERYA